MGAAKNLKNVVWIKEFINLIFMDEILIPISKKKIKLLLLLSIIFFLIGICCIAYKEIYYFSIHGIDTNTKQLGYFFICWFGFVLIIGGYKMFDKSPKLIIHKYGITDKTGNIEIFWKDITKLSVYETHGQQFLNIHVHNPQEYLDNQTKTITRKAMWLNYKVRGTPLCISTSVLDISFDELKEIIAERISFYNGSNFKKY